MATTAPQTPASRGTPPTSLAEIAAPLQGPLRAFEAAFTRQAGELEAELRESAEYALHGSGKRLRPLLVLSAGYGSANLDELVQAAVIVEMVHLATLVHDDILDRAALRHERETVSKRFGADTAVLLGDALFAHALHLAAQFPTTEVCRTVSLATRRVCSGEIAQNHLARDHSLGRERYFRLIELKTAELFVAACRLGASLAGHGEAFAEAAAAYGRGLGIAYQLYDDLVDLLGNESASGKTLGTDLAHGKFTLPWILLFEHLSEGERRMLLEEPSCYGHGSREALALMARFGCVEGTREALESTLAQAEAALDAFRPLAAVERLELLGHFLRQRVTKLTREGSHGS